MDIEKYRDYCLAKKGVTESFPFDLKVLVFKVGDKMFALTDVDAFESVNLKCDPDYAISLREQYESIRPGYHMSKKHWNTIDSQGDVSDKLFFELIDHSYDLVVSKLTKKVRESL